MEYKYRFDDDDHYDGTNNPKYIVIHDTGNYTDSDEGNANYFCTGTRNASAHLFVDSDSCTQVVRFEDGAFHCGDGNGKYGITNNNSIGIEMCRVNGVVTAQTEINTINLVKDLMKKFNIPIERVVRHFDASNKNCPSSFNLDGRWTRWNEFKNKLNGSEYMVKCTGFSYEGKLEVGEYIRLTATAEPFEDAMYKFWVCDRQTGEWTVIQNYIKKSYITSFTPDKKGNYTLVVHVKHEKSTNEYDEVRAIDIYVSDKKSNSEDTEVTKLKQEIIELQKKLNDIKNIVK